QTLRREPMGHAGRWRQRRSRSLAGSARGAASAVGDVPALGRAGGLRAYAKTPRNRHTVARRPLAGLRMAWAAPCGTHYVAAGAKGVKDQHRIYLNHLTH